MFGEKFGNFKGYSFLNKLYPFLFSILSIQLNIGCTSRFDREISKSEKEIQNNQIEPALNRLSVVIKESKDEQVTLRALRIATKISFLDLKKFKEAVDLYRKVIVVSKDEDERLDAQKKIAEIYFDHLNDYGMAIIELNKLIPMIKDPVDNAKFRKNLSRAYYYQNNFEQAENEVEEFLLQEIPDEIRFEMLLLKSNIFVGQKKLPEAIQILRTLIRDYPEFSKKDNVQLTLSVLLEEQGDFIESKNVLTDVRSWHNQPEMIDIRLKRLEERIKNRPGARGLNKK